MLDHLYVPALTEALLYDRCCAYFSSSVLAAAARGFAKLIVRLLAMGKDAPKPAVRLVVNEELSLDDVRALTETGDTSTLARLLVKRFKDPKDMLQRKRLAMLGWLAKTGYLELRVGVMRGGGGIVHGKFGVMTDEAGDAIVFNGSGNESAQGLVANYERVDVSTSWDDPAAYNEYSGEFDALWSDDHPDVHTVTLPEALRLKLIKFAPKEPPVEEPIEAGERQKAAMVWRFIVEAPYLANGEAACDATAMVELWPHQRHVVEETARAWPNGRLLCDEVGLGKTIEAIFVLRRLMAGRGVKRALLLLPKSLVRQWQDELREKGGMVFPRLEGPQTLVWPDGTTKKLTGLAEALTEDVLLMSRETARRESNLTVLLEAEPWDLVLLDEAHAARRKSQEEGEYNSPTLLLGLLRQLQLRRQARGILLLSATPMQTHPWEPWDLLAVLGEGPPWLAEFPLVRELYGAIPAVRAGKCDMDRAARVAGLLAADREFPAPPGQGGGDGEEDFSRALAFASPTQREELVRWLRDGSPLGRRMHRNTRETLRAYHRMGLLADLPPSREVEDVIFDYTDSAERQVYESITRYIDRRFEILEEEKPGKGFVMTVYRRRASSSPLALERSLERRREGLQRVTQQWTYDQALSLEDIPEAFEEDDLPEGDTGGDLDPAFPEDPQVAREELKDIDAVLAELTSLGGQDSKLEKLHDILRRVTVDGRPVLVFTEYVDTMEYLRESLLQLYDTRLGCFSGAGGQMWDGEQWGGVTKDAITRALRNGKLSALICTDAASEGLNLQAAGALINYDLPWNPSKVEQRIGRIDRIGQECAVVRVVNVFLENSVDDRVYTVLRERCGLFQHFVGAMQPVLARARKMLMGRETVDPSDLEAGAAGIDEDPLLGEIYVEATPEESSGDKASVTIQDVRSALLLAGKAGGMKVKRSKDGGSLDVGGLEKRRVRFALSVEMLEGARKALPPSPLTPQARMLADKLGRTGERFPLVVESAQEGGFRASVALWVSGGRSESVESLSQLVRQIERWNGEYPSPEDWQKSVKKAGRAAKKRVSEMSRRASEREERALSRQAETARLRLTLELGRYLVCLGVAPDVLSDRMYQEMQRGTATAERLKRCFDRLGGYPEWSPALQRELTEFARSLSPNRVTARRAGSEVDAALDDPRWAALGTREE